MTPSPSPSTAADALTNIASALSSIAAVVDLPSWAKIIVYGAATVCGAAALYFASRYVTDWWNELTSGQRDADATAGRNTADQSDQNLNTQTSKLPKE